MNKDNIIDSVLLTLGTAFSLSNIESLLGIVILIVQIMWLSFKLIYSLKNNVKHDKPIEELDDEFNDVIKKITELKNEVDNKEQNGDDTNKQ